ncbi:MAG: hypothetical protein B7Z66_10545 [Chromatiales bacterium 21-64-14]|nr:MAG: hypothetical protein B7Z66_10545 [Chromatiales bacterium 21-64-14]HQU15762.1 dynamin family protein [Gammaproteobacteria bacterium]
MTADLLQTQLGAYNRWKQVLGKALGQYQQWLDGCRLSPPDADLRIIECLEALDSDRLVIAFVGEFSRGKTELINALFFSDYRRRLLPTEAGRTTMCPTELFHDAEAVAPYLKLLPIETRLRDTTISEYIQDPLAWNTTPLDMDSPDQMVNALREIRRVRRVPVPEAKRLGLYDASLHTDLQAQGVPVTHVEIPVWRHARVSFPHPLLKQGLVVLDTPGLNALGNEPELTLNLLPKAHAMVFVLAADTGVTRSDLELWNHHVRGYRYRKDGCLVVALNKIDTLWDELRDPTEVTAAIENQRRTVARELGLGSRSVFPVSAQKALVAKIRHDPRLLRNAQLAELEAHVCTQILPIRHEILQESLARRMDELLEESRSVLRARMNDVRNETRELRGLRGKSSDVVLHLMRKNRQAQALYLKHVQSFNEARRELGNRARSVMEILDLSLIDTLIDQARIDMEGSWTTPGLKRGMKVFFEGIARIMGQVAPEVYTAERLVKRVYADFQQRLDAELARPQPLPMEQRVAEFTALHHEAEEFRNSVITSMTEQSFVIRKFFDTLASRARGLFIEVHDEADRWLKDVLGPLVRRLHDHKTMLDQRRANLQKIQRSRQSLDERIAGQEAQILGLEEQLSELDWIQNSLHRPLPAAAAPPAGIPTKETARGALAG